MFNYKQSICAAMLGLICSSGYAVEVNDAPLVPLQEQVNIDDTVWEHFNWAAFDQNKIVSHGDYQYTAFYDADSVLVIARRQLSNNNIQTIRLPYKLTGDITNGHRNSVLGMSLSDGRLHISWDHHNNSIRYTKSIEGFLTNPPAQISKDHFQGKHYPVHDMPQKVTYPRFIADNNGDLLLMYRSGHSGNGQTVLLKYSGNTSKWEVVGDNLFGKTGKFYGWVAHGSSARNPYFHDVLFDKDGRLHATWTYRETSSTWASNHDLYYAYSDNHGKTWKNNSGKTVGDVSKNDTVELLDDGIKVVDIPCHSWLMNQCAMALDNNGQPHVLTYKMPEPIKYSGNVIPSNEKHKLRFFHYYRKANGTWISSDPIAPPKGTNVSRPDIAIDQNNNLVFLFHNQHGNFAYVAKESEQWKSWTLVRLTEAGIRAKQSTKIDRTRFQKNGIFSFSSDHKAKKSSNGFTILDFSIHDIIATAENGEPTLGDNNTNPNDPTDPVTPPITVKDFVLVDDMEGTNNWITNGNIGGTLSNDPTNSDNTVYRIDSNNKRCGASLPLPTIANNSVGTLFFRIRSDAASSNFVWGSSDVVNPIIGASISSSFFNQYEGYGRLYSNGFNVRNAGKFDFAESAQSGTWYNIWLVLDNQNDRTSMYISTDTNDASNEQAFVGNFRNGTQNSLSSLLLYAEQNGAAYIDDIYLDQSGINLNLPFSADAPNLAPIITSGTITLRGQVQDPDGNNVSVTVNNKTAQIDNGNWSIDVTVEEGDNFFDVIATDEQNQESYQEILINWSPTAEQGAG